MAACLPPAESTLSIPSLVDRADIVVLASVARSEPLASTIGDPDARRYTLRTMDVTKGTIGPALRAVGHAVFHAQREGRRIDVLFLDETTVAVGGQPLFGRPVAVIHGTAERSVAQLLADARAVRPLDGDARALFQGNGRKVTGKHVVDEFELPTSAEFALAGREIRAYGAPWSSRSSTPRRFRRRSASTLHPFAGKPAELLTFFLEGNPGEFPLGTALGHAFMSQRRSWARGCRSGRSWGPSRSASGLSCWQPRRASLPRGRRHRIASSRASTLPAPMTSRARAIAYKTGTGGNGDITDPARIHAFASALDETLPTYQVTFDRETPPTKYWFHVDFTTRSLSLEYDTRDGVLAVRLDGLSVKAPPAFSAFDADVR